MRWWTGGSAVRPWQSLAERPTLCSMVHRDRLSEQRCWHVLFVCMGNICRSPTAEGVFRPRRVRRGCWTGCGLIRQEHNYHPGDATRRALAGACARDGAMTFRRCGQARLAHRDDFARFDLIVGDG